MKYHYTGAPRTCERPSCGKVYQPKSHNQRYCCYTCKAAIAMEGFKARNPEYWQQYLTRKRENAIKVPKAIKPPYNPKPCSLCKQPLGRTANRFYHPDCHRRISYLEGVDCFEVTRHQRNGHHAPN
jgi:hypothetical protein